MKMGFLLFALVGLDSQTKNLSCLFGNLYQKYKQGSLVVEKTVATVKYLSADQIKTSVRACYSSQRTM